MRRFGRFLALLAAVTMFVAACGGPAPTQAPAATDAPAAATDAPAAATDAPAAATDAPAATSAPAAASEVIIAIGADPTTLDPQARDDGGEQMVNNSIYDTLLARDADMEIVPSLATDYEQLDDSTWQFTLRDDVTFHNGEPFNADAVVFSVERIIDPDFNSEQLSFFETITGAEAVDEYTVNIFTNGRDPILPARMYWMKMVPPGYFGEAGNPVDTAPVGSGPYKFVSWSRGSEVVLEANADYWGGAPAIDRVVIRTIPEESTRLAALQAGEVDLVRDLIPEQIDVAPVAKHTPGLEFPIIRLNNKEGILQDVRLRQAMNYAVDKEGLAEALFEGYAVVAQGQILTPGHFGFNPNLQPYPYDPDRARELIAETDYDGAVIDFYGESGRWLKDKETIEAVAAQLNEVGLNVQVQIFEFTRYLDFVFAQENQPQIIYVSHDNPLLDADRTLSAYFHCTGRISSYCNEEVSQLIDDARTETDEARREQMYHQATQISYDEAALIYMLNVENIYGLSTRLNWEPRLDNKVFFNAMTLN